MSNPSDGEENFARPGRDFTIHSIKADSGPSLDILKGKTSMICSNSFRSIIISFSTSSENIEEKEAVNDTKHNWTRRHFWALHIATFVIAFSASAALIFWLNDYSGISMVNSFANFFNTFLEPVPGTIVAWVPLDKTSEPPNKWVICDGREVEEGDWKGRLTPDLTNKFLIGQKKDDVNGKLAKLDELTQTTELIEYSGTNLQGSGSPYDMTTYDVVYIMRID